jgi:predicted transcriptional regulator
MTIDLTPAEESRLLEIASEAQRTPEEIAQEAVSGWLRHVSELAADIHEAEQSAEREGWLTHDEVFERLNVHLTKAA